MSGLADIRALETFHTDYHLLDAHRSGMRGGTGETFDWELVRIAPLEDPARAQRRPAARERRPRRSPRCARSPSTRPAAPRPAPASRTRRRWRPSWRRSRSTRAAGGGAMSAVEHRFGPYGGQYVPETLMPALAELEEAWVAACGRRGLPRRARRAAARLRRAARRRCTSPTGSARSPGGACTSSARTSTTPARTRSTTPSARRCWPGGWASGASSPRPAPASTASPRRPRAR